MTVLFAKILRLDAKIREVYHDIEEEVEREEKFVRVLEQSLAVLQTMRLKEKREKAEYIRSRSGSIVGAARQQSSRVTAFTGGPVSDESRFAHQTPRNFATSYAVQSGCNLPHSSISGKLIHSAAQARLPPRNPNQLVPKLPLGSRDHSRKSGMGAGPKAILLELEQAKFEKTFEKLQDRIKGFQQDSESHIYNSTTVTPFEMADRPRVIDKAQRRFSSDKSVRNEFTSSTGGLKRRGSERFDRQSNSRNSSHSGSHHLNKTDLETLRSLSRLKQFSLKKLQLLTLGGQRKEAIQERSLESSGVAITNALQTLNRNGSKNSAELVKKASLAISERPTNSRRSEKEMMSPYKEKSVINLKNVPSVPLGTPARGMSRNNSGVRQQRTGDSIQGYRELDVDISERGPEQVASQKVSPKVRSIEASDVPEQIDPPPQNFGRELLKPGNMDSTGGMIPNTMIRPKLPHSNYSLGLEGSPILANRDSEYHDPAKRSAQATLVGIAGMLLRDSRQIRPDLNNSVEPNFVMQSFDPFSSKLASYSPVRHSNIQTDKES